MTEAAYKTGPDAIDEMELSDALDSFVSHVMATADLMWAGAEHDGLGEETLGRVAYNLSTEAWYLRKRLDRQHKEQMEQIYKDRPELLEVNEVQDDQMEGRDLLGDCIAIDTLLSAMIHFDENSDDGVRACDQQTLATIAREKFSELREGIDKAVSSRWQHSTSSEGGAS